MLPRVRVSTGTCARGRPVSVTQPGGFSTQQVFEMDIAKQLQAYEVEYHVLQEELIESSPLSDNQRMEKLEPANTA